MASEEFFLPSPDAARDLPCGHFRKMNAFSCAELACDTDAVFSIAGGFFALFDGFQKTMANAELGLEIPSVRGIA